jgi:hypothetical protein
MKVNQGKLFMLHMRLTIEHFFPELLSELCLLPDHRKQKFYSTKELTMAAICMFLFKRGSRNAMNQTSEKTTFADNYKKLFGISCPHLDATEDFFRQLPTQVLEAIKHGMIKKLLEKKSLHKFRLLKLYHIIAIDGVNQQSYSYEPFEGCPFRKQNAETVWLVNLVEAKLVYSNGFCLSVATEYMKNEDGAKKQDCEQKAAVRICNKIKQLFPNLPICLAADGLYPSEPMFKLCIKYQWKYIFTLKDYCLETVWQEIRFNYLFKLNQSVVKQNCIEHKWTQERWRFVNNTPFHKVLSVNWIEYERSVYNKKTKTTKTNRFVHITNVDMTPKNAIEVSYGGRLRWTIENQGFNEQKNRGYELKHKYSRQNLNANQNYYQCLQIAHMIAQLCVKCKAVQKLKGRCSEKTLWEDMLAELIKCSFCEKEINQIICIKCQFRY